MQVWQLSSKKSLRKSILETLKEDQPDLYISKKPNILKNFISYLSDKRHWWTIPPLVIGIYIALTLINIPFFAVVSIDEKIADTLIDQRTSNVATIISMTLAVIGLLLGNLAIKEPITYNLLFIRSRVHLIVTYTLSTILCLILTSTLRNSTPVGYEYLYPQAVLAGTYMVISILFFIGYLFRTVMLFSNSHELQQVLKDEFFSEAKKNIRLHLLNKLSKQRYIDLMRRMEYTEASFWSGLGGVIIENEDDNVDLFKDDKLIYDINLIDLEARLKKCDPAISKEYLALGINEVSGSHTSYISINVSGSCVDIKFNKIKLEHYLVRKSADQLLSPSFEFAKYFEGKLEEYAEQGKIKKANEVLALFGDIYELEMKHT